METPALTIITPTVHPDRLPILEYSLNRQTFTDFEWIIVAPERLKEEIKFGTFLVEPPKNKGDFWCLNKAWNKAFANAKGELLISYQDNIYIPPDTLERLWFHYQTKPKALVATIGHQYNKTDERGVPINLIWRDPRARMDFGTFYQVPATEVEFSFCSVPRQAVIDVGGVDEVYDTCPGLGEKEMCFRMERLGYEFFIDQSIEYKAIQHPRQTADWDEKYYSITSPLYSRHLAELKGGKRNPNVGCIEKHL
jgi:hypothetical protein